MCKYCPDYVDTFDVSRERVDCDDDCGAYEEPQTLEEYAATLEHYKTHPYLYGCSHGA